jgi:hypothetical protein
LCIPANPHWDVPTEASNLGPVKLALKGKSWRWSSTPLPRLPSIREKQVYLPNRLVFTKYQNKFRE